MGDEFGAGVKEADREGEGEGGERERSVRKGVDVVTGMVGNVDVHVHDKF